MALNPLSAEYRRCPGCNEEKPIGVFGKRKVDGKHYPNAACLECRKDRTRAYRHLNPSARLLSSCRARAKRLGLPFDITEEDLAIPERCPILGIPLLPDYTRRTDNTPSVDRIVASKGYVRGNVAIISWRANRLKSDASLTETMEILRYMVRGTTLH